MGLRELPIPTDVATDYGAVELLRVWVAHGGQHVSLAAGIWEDPANWGIMLVDLAKHIASSYHEQSGEDVVDLLARIRQGFDAEWECSTDDPSGKLVE